MVIIELFINYWRWHYTRAFRDLFLIWFNFIWFLWNYFSIRQLASTFFVPWKRLRENNPSILEFFEFFSSVVITLLMRIVGILIRTVIIVIGLISIFLMVALGLGFFIVWILMPMLLFLIFTIGWQLAFQLSISKF